MTKIEIVANVYEKLGFSKRECADIVDKFFEVIKETLASGENVKISGFGNFIVKQKKARRAVSYTHLRAHETVLDLVCRLLLEKKNQETLLKH